MQTLTNNADSRATLSALSHAQLVEKVERLTHQLEWFQRQLFGQKSERIHLEPDARQLALGEIVGDIPAAPPVKTRSVASHHRRVALGDAGADEQSPFFDRSRVPVETIVLADPETVGEDPDAFERIGEKRSCRLAQRRASYVVLEYLRPMHKRKDTRQITCAAAPAGVIDGSRADVSFLAGLLVDKLAYHLPLYRQHQRLVAAGIDVSRPWLTQISQKTIALLEPIYEAQLASVRLSRVIAMDETPIKAGLAKPGKMKAAYFWPVYGEQDEICFVYHPDRYTKNIYQTLGMKRPDGAVLLTDGYAAYARYARKLGLTHAQCWAHCRRHFFEAQDFEPERALKALEQIGELYAIEDTIRERGLTGNDKRLQRQQLAKPAVDAFFRWVDDQFERQALLPSSPLTQALAYARERREGLGIYLDDPDVAIDTNHLERALRVIPMGRRNWLFCWTELGAHQIGIAQSLLTTCRLHKIDPYTYLVDVLQRISLLPASRVGELTPRLWKELYAANPLRSALDSPPP